MSTKNAKMLVTCSLYKSYVIYHLNLFILTIHLSSGEIVFCPFELDVLYSSVVQITSIFNICTSLLLIQHLHIFKLSCA